MNPLSNPPYHLLCIGVVLILVSFQPLTADAATMNWGLKFLNQDGGYAGSGSFSYDTETPVFVNQTPLPSGNGFFVDAALNQFSASLLGQSVDYVGNPDNPIWWADDNNLPGQRLNVGGIPFITNFWFFGDTDLSQLQSLVLSGMNKLEPGVRWTGSWSFDIAGNQANPLGLHGLGTWIATPVPLPAALPLFASALAALGLVSFRRRASARPA